MNRTIGTLVGIVLVVVFASWFFGWGFFNKNSSDELSQSNLKCPAGYTCTLSNEQHAEVVNSRNRKRYSDNTIAAQWLNGLKRTPPPRGHKWKRIKPRATGEYGCRPGETRVNPRTGRLQGCR